MDRPRRPPQRRSIQYRDGAPAGRALDLVSFFFYLPLALLGLPPAMFMVHKNLNLLYQFWIHTEVVGSIGPLEMVPTRRRTIESTIGPAPTPTGVLIIWDRLFGTFISEGGAQVDNYGLGEPTLSFDPLWMQFVTAHRTLTRLGLRALLFRRRIRHRFVVRPAALAAAQRRAAVGRRRPFVLSMRVPSRNRGARVRPVTPCSSWPPLVVQQIFVARRGPPSPPPSSSSPPTTSDASPTATAAPSPSRARAPSRSASRLHFGPAAAAAAAPPRWLALRAAGGFERGGGGRRAEAPAKKTARPRATASPARRQVSRASEEVRRDLQPSPRASPRRHASTSPPPPPRASSA